MASSQFRQYSAYSNAMIRSIGTLLVCLGCQSYSGQVLAESPLIIVPVHSGSSDLFEGAVQAVAEIAGDGRDEVYTLAESLGSLRASRGYGPVESAEEDLDALAAYQATVQSIEEAFYEMDYGRAQQLLADQGVVGFQRTFEAYAPHNERIDWVKRGFIVRFRVHMVFGNQEKAVALVNEAVSVFPGWQPSEAVLPPSLRRFFLETRDRYLLEQETVLVRTPYEHCAVYINGVHLATGQNIQLPQAERGGAVGLSCVDGLPPVYWVWYEPFPQEVFLEPLFYHGDEIMPELLFEQGLISRERADFLRNAMTQMFPVYELLILSPDRHDAESLSLYFLGRISGSTVLTGAEGRFSLSMRERRRQQVVEDLMEGPSGELSSSRGLRLERATWGLLGVGGAGALMMMTAAIIEANAYEQFQGCEQNPGCRSGSVLDLWRRRGESASLWATSGAVLGVGCAASAVVLWLLKTGEDERPEVLSGAGSDWVNRVSFAAWRVDAGRGGLGWGISMSASY